MAGKKTIAQDRITAIQKLSASLPAEPKHLPPRTADRAGAIFLVRFGSAAKAALVLFLTEMAVGRERISMPALARAWTTIERPPSIQAARRALLLALCQLATVESAKESMHIDCGTGSVMYDSTELVSLKKNAAIVGGDLVVSPLSTAEWRPVPVPKH